MANVANDVKIAALYSAVFYRAPDKAGLDYWLAQAEADGNLLGVAQSFTQHPAFVEIYGSMSNRAFVEKLYINVLGAAGDTSGIDYWVSRLVDGTTRAQMLNEFVVSALEMDLDAALAAGELTQADYDLAIVRQNTLLNKAEAGVHFAETFDYLSNLDPNTDTTTVEGLESDPAYLAAQAAIANVDNSAESLAAAKVAINAATTPVDLINQVVSDKTFTLIENRSTVEGTPAVTAVYWGYNPNSTTGDPDAADGIADGGIPVEDLVSFLTTITGLDLYELGLIDADGTDPFENVTSLSLSNPTGANSNSNTGDNNTQDSSTTLTINFADGSSLNAEVALGDAYFEFLNNLLFDADGNSRLFEKVIVPATTDEEIIRPIKLTASTNNGGTQESGYTTDGNEVIVAGRLELLHQAYIDAGGGYNILEVDAKGTYAQPVELLNIQEVRVNDLPNFYTTDYGDGDGNLDNTNTNDNGFPVPQDPATVDNSSWLDLSRATSLQKLVVTDQSSDSGDLTIVGVRNGATLRLEGSFQGGETTIQYGQGQSGELNVQLAIGTVTEEINLLQNAATLNIDSQGDANHMQQFFAGGSISRLNITGTGSFTVDGNLSSSFNTTQPVIIDASTNLGGVSLGLTGPEKITFKGTAKDDTFRVTTGEVTSGGTYFDHENDQYVVIQAGEGNDHFEVDTYSATITGGNGNSNYEVNAVVASITAGNGANDLELEVNDATVTLGNGDNTIEVVTGYAESTTAPDSSADAVSNVVIVAGNGKNVIDVEQAVEDAAGDSLYEGNVDITVGNGGNDIDVIGANTVSITSGSGNDTIRVVADSITVSTGGGNDNITVVGLNDDFAGTSADIDDGAYLNINTGTGSATITLGLTQDDVSGGNNSFPQYDVNSITALEGSSIAGENITLFVNTAADLRAATLSGITKVVLDDDNDNYTDSGQANDGAVASKAILTLTSDQFKDIGAAAFSVQGSVFSTHAYIKIIVTESTSLTDLLDGAELPSNIDLFLELNDGVTLTLTAEQLHTNVAPEGITLADDGNTDAGNGKVVITGGGLDFDPFNTSDTVKTNIEGTVYYGGSLSNDFRLDGTDAGTVVGDSASDPWYNITVRSLVNGFDRPTDVPVQVVVTLDSGTGLGSITQGAFSTWHTNLEIIGEKDITFTGAVSLGVESGVPTNPFTIDFSQLEAEVTGFTVDNFELLGQGGAIYGNADAGYESEVWISLADDDAADGVGFDEADATGLVSRGVSKYVVTTIDGPTANGSVGSNATIKLSDSTQDLEVLALRGNYNDTLIVEDAAWGLDFELQGGSTAKADGPTGTANIGKLEASYEWPGAEAVVTIDHSVATDTRPFKAYGISINNAASITINVDGADATIDSIEGNEVTTLNFNSDDDIAVTATLPTSVEVLDASEVTGTFTATIDPAGDFTFEGAVGGSTLTFAGDFTATAATEINGSAAGVDLIIADDLLLVDLSAATLSNIDQVTLGDDTSLALTVDQAVDIGTANFVIATGDNATLSLSGLNAQAFSANYADGIVVTEVEVAAVPAVTLNAATNLSDVGKLVLSAGTVLTLTAAQFQQLVGSGTIEGGATNSINIVGLTQADVDAGFNLTGIDSDISVTVTAVESITFATADNLNGADLVIGNDMTVAFADINQADGLSIAGGTNSTVQFNDTSLANNGGVNASIDASGFDVDTLKMLNSLIENTNIDAVFDGLSERVTKVVFDDFGQVAGVDQTFTVGAGVTIPGDVAFSMQADDVEIENFTLNLQGGAEVSGNLDLSTEPKQNASGEDLLRTHLQTLTINSTGTAANGMSGAVANLITGAITPLNGVDAAGNNNNLLSVTINATQALVVEDGIVFSSVTGDDSITANDNDEAVATLTLNGTAAVNVGAVDTSDVDVAGLNVINNGTGTLTLVLDAAKNPATDLSFTGSNIAIQLEGNVDLSDDVTTGVSTITLNDGATLTLTQAQLVALGIADLLDGEVAGSATLNLVGFGATPFDATAIASGINVGTITLAAGSITLDATTDLTGVDAIIIPEDGVLTLTAEQFLQLNGSIAGDATNSINIVGLTQAIVDEGFDLSGIAAGIQISVTAVESITFAVTDDLNGADLIIGNDMTVAFADIDQADGLSITGGTNSTVQFNDTSLTNNGGAAASIDASGFDVDVLKMLNVLIENTNIDAVFDGLSERVTKVVFNSFGDVVGVSQTFTVEPGVTIPGDVAFSMLADDVEITNFTLNLQGGVEVSGDLDLSTEPKTSGVGEDLLRTHLQTLIINSTGTAGNTLSGATTNIIDGAITPLNGLDAAGNNNNLLSVTINATQALVVEDGIVFSSVTGDDDITANDNDEAVATLTLNGTAAVNVGAVDTSDADVAGLNVINNGTGTLTLVLDAAKNPATDLSFTGSNIAIQLEGNVDLSDDVTTGVSTITLNDAATLTLTQAQLADLGAANLLDGEVAGSATLHLVAFGSDAFDATALDTDITLSTITLVNADVTLNSATNLTDVGSIRVQEGTTLTLTAAQFQQLLGNGTISGVDTDGDSTVEAFDVVITDLTQADIDAGFNLTSIAGVANITLSLAEDVDFAAATDIADAVVTLADGQTLGLATSVQADGLQIEGAANTTVVFQFENMTGGDTSIDASGYGDVENGLLLTTLKALATFVSGENVETLILGLPENVIERYYADPEELGFVSGVNRTVVVEADVTVDGQLIYNDLRDTVELRSLTLTLEGGSTIDGNINLSTNTEDADLVTRFFDILTINSEGDDDNTITGNISAAALVDANPALAGNQPSTANNLLNVVINAAQDLVIGNYNSSGVHVSGGDIVFNNVDATDDTAANLSVTGTADVTLHGVDVTDAVGGGIDVLNITNTSTGTLTLTGGTAAIAGTGVESIVLAGTGDIVMGSDDNGTGAEGISSTTLSEIDASGLSGDLVLAEITVDGDDFTFTSGTGVTTLTVDDDALTADADGADNIEGNSDDEPGWTFDLSNAAAGSELHLADNSYTSGDLSIDLGANATLYIDADTDFSQLDNLDIQQVQSIVLRDGATLTLTAAQANGLNIVAGTDTGSAGITARVNIVELSNDPLDENPVDLSGIASNIAGLVTLDGNDVTLGATTNLGDFTVQLTAIEDTLDSMVGQTIRFATVEQAERDVVVIDDADAVNNLDGTPSTNVVWLFSDALAAPIDTAGYSADIGRVWFNQELVNNNSGEVENLFTTLPNSILRLDFTDINLLNVLLNSNQINRVVEMVAFTQLNDLSFSDIGTSPEEHVRSLRIDMGGQVTIGDIMLDDVIASGYNVPSFTGLTINSMLALEDTHYLAPEGYVNDNDSVDETGEHVQPNPVNTVGDIGVGGNNGLDLTSVTLNADEANLVVGTITFDSETAASTATLTTQGSEDITIASVNTTDAQITTLVINHQGSGTLDIVGASPAAAVSNTETLTINLWDDGDINLGTEGDDTKPGISGATLSKVEIIADDGDGGHSNSTVNLGVIALVDGVEPVAPATWSFQLLATDTLFDGSVTAVLSGPTLEADGAWLIDGQTIAGTNYNIDLTIDGDTTFGAGTLQIDSANLVISGNVDISSLETFTLTNYTLDVPAGASLTLTAAQADGLTITGGGTVEVLALEATPGADLGGIMTDNGDTGVVNAYISTADDADVDADPENIALTGDLGVAHVTITGDGVVDATAATTGLVDRNDPATPATVADDELPSFVVGDTATLVLTASQVGNATGLPATAWQLLAEGTGTVEVEDLSLNPDADLSGLTTAVVEAAVDLDVTFTGVIGSAVVTVADTKTMTVAASIVDGETINGEGTVLVTGNATGDNFSSFGIENISFDIDATVQNTTFPVLTADQTVNLSSIQASGEVITGLGDVNVNVVEAGTDLTPLVGGSTPAEDAAAAAAFDLSTITATGDLVATVSADYALHTATNMGTFDVSLLNGVDLTLTTTQLLAIGVADISGVAGGAAETLIVNDYNGENIQSDELGTDVTIATLNVQDTNGTITLHASIDLSRITNIVVPEGTTLVLTAAQYNAWNTNLLGGTISGTGAGLTQGKVNITGVTQAVIDAGFNVSSIDAQQGTMTFTGDVVLDPAGSDMTVVEDFELILANNQTLVLSNFDQADGRVFSKASPTDVISVVLGFDGANVEIDASGYDAVDELYVDTLLIEGHPTNNLEEVVETLDSGVNVTIFGPDTLGLPTAVTVNPDAYTTIRTVTIEAGTTVGSDLQVWEESYVGDATEVAELTLTMDGNTSIAGDLVLNAVDPATIVADGFDPNYFRSLTIRSQNSTTVIPGSNSITGDIYGDGTGTGSENTLNDITIEAEEDFTIGGAIRFSSVAKQEAFILDLSDTMSIVDADTFSFDGTTINLTSGWNSTQVATAIAGGAFVNWTVTQTGDELTFVHNAGGTLADVVQGDFGFTDVGAVSTDFEGTVDIVVQGAGAEAEALLTLEDDADITIDALLVDDSDIDTLRIVNNNTGVVTIVGLGTNPDVDGAIDFDSAGATGNHLIIEGTGASLVLGTAGPGIDADDLVSIDASGFDGDLAFGEIEDLDAAGTFTFTGGGDAVGDVVTMTLGTGVSMTTTSDWTFSFAAAATNTLSIDTDFTTSLAAVNTGSLSITGVDTLILNTSVDFSNLVHLNGSNGLTLSATEVQLAAGTTTMRADQAAGVNFTGSGDLVVEAFSSALAGATIEGADGDDTLAGTQLADTFTGNGGINTYVYTLGDSVNPTASADNGGAGLDNGDTITFSNGVDVITDFDATSLFEDFINTGLDRGAGDNDSATFDVNAGTYGITDGGFAVIQGDYAGSVFTTDTGTPSHTLIAFDADNTGGISIEFIMLVGNVAFNETNI